MKKVFIPVFVILIFAVSSLFIACEEDKAKPDRPVITAPLAVQEVTINSMKEVSCGVMIPGGFKSASYTTYGGTFAIPGTTSLEVGDKSGDITGTFTAGGVAGFGQVALTVIDKNDKADVAYINFHITE